MDTFREIIGIIEKYVDEGIHVIDREGKTILYNKAMEGIEGLDENEVMGKKLLEVFPSLNENTSTLFKVLNSGEPIIEKYQSYINKKGYSITTVNSTIPVSKDGEIIGAIEISKDFTKIKELYDRIIQLTDNSNDKKNSNNEICFERITGCSPKFIKAIEMAKKAANSSSTVLIYGDTGTGKEVFSKCIHNGSLRRDKPFIAINCAALPEGLLEGILFGTVKGGFTGAIDRPGLFEQANGGTLLLDEINSMSVGLQAKLLRVLQEGYIRRVGDVKDIKIDVRIIATTNEEPNTVIANGTFRKDLYYRLSVVNITIPPLKDRKEDIQLFVKEFIKKYNKEFSKDVWDAAGEVYDAFMSYSWPGNVRELKNYIEGSMNMVVGHILRKEHFNLQVQDTLFEVETHQNNNITLNNFSLNGSLDEHLSKIEKDIIITSLKGCDYNISEAARILKIKRQTLQHKMKKYNIIIN
jgi:arginine utilization regulatory protein